ncbi:type II toxin-antitoxin system mRNA interferase toxin, RelE/StbE family, partial [Campylobacter jejuni]
LKENLKGIRDYHIRPNLILLYEKNNNELILTALRIGKHSELGLSNDR